jgi:hypothetical protein
VTFVSEKYVSRWQIGEKSVLSGIFRISPVLGCTANFFPYIYSWELAVRNYVARDIEQPDK